MDKKAKNILVSILWLALAAVLLLLCLRQVDWKQFGQALRLCRWPWVLVSMILGVVVFWLRGSRWQRLLGPIDPEVRPARCFHAYNICMAANLLIPRSGEIIRCVWVSRGREKMSFDKALGTLLAERVWDVVITLGMAAALLGLLWNRFGSFFMENVVSAIGGAPVLIAAIAALLVLAALFVWLCYRLSSKGGLWGKVWGFFRGMGTGLASFAHMKDGWKFLLETVAIWTIYTLMCWTVLLSLRPVPEFAGLGMADAFFLMILGSISSVVPVPGGFGAYHGLVAGALAAVWGMPFSSAMVFAVLSHESQALTQAISGGLSYIWDGLVKKNGRI